MSKNIIGFVLIDAPHSALNNAGEDAGARTENTVAIKTIRRGKDSFPYVSAQAWRYWWRDTLLTKFNWIMSPIIREKKIAFTAANPFVYADDDVLGYMRALKDAKKKKDTDSESKDEKNKSEGTLTRLSPLKNSPLIAVFPQQATDDFGVMARHEGDPVPYEHQFYSVVLKGIFSLDLTTLGSFGAIAKTGFKNLDEKYIVTDDIKKAIENSNATKDDKNNRWVLPKEIRIKRAKETISALPYLSGGAKQTLHHTDVTPKFIILAVIEGGNNLFMNIATQDEKKIINIKALKEVVTDYKQIILSDIYIGRHEGFQDSVKVDLETLKSELNSIKQIHLSSPKRAVENFVTVVDNFIE